MEQSNIPYLPRLLTKEELAEQLSISIRHLLELQAQKLIPVIKLGRCNRYNPAAVASALESLTIQGRPSYGGTRSTG